MPLGPVMTLSRFCSAHRCWRNLIEAQKPKAKLTSHKSFAYLYPVAQMQWMQCSRRMQYLHQLRDHAVHLWVPNRR